MFRVSGAEVVGERKPPGAVAGNSPAKNNNKARCQSPKSPTSDTSILRTNAMEAVYTVRSAPGEGLGCFSTALIPAGTLILAETPLFNVQEPRSNAAVLDAFSHLSATEKAQYLELHSLEPVHDSNARVIDIFNSNAWQTGSRTSICPQAARFNHSCVPNASFAWNSQLSKITVHAIITIPADAQIKVSYELPYQIREARQRKLLAYRFVCACESCGPGPSSAASDLRRARMIVLNARIRCARRQMWISPAPIAAMKLIRLLQEEGLVGEALGLAFHDAAVGWLRHGRLDLAIKYALKELEICLRCFGSTSHSFEVTSAFLTRLHEDLGAQRKPDKVCY